jgi:hypothetical protein
MLGSVKTGNRSLTPFSLFRGTDPLFRGNR